MHRYSNGNASALVVNENNFISHFTGKLEELEKHTG